MLGNPGAPTRPRPIPDLDDEPGGRASEGWVPALPSTCIRVLSSPRGECQVDCVGRQPDGSCLCDIVRAANEKGVEWTFEIDRDGCWCYTGPDL